MKPLQTWNQAKLDILQAAIMDARLKGQSDVTFSLAESHFKPKVSQTLPLAEAEELAAQLRQDMRNNPMPVFGENREGREP